MFKISHLETKMTRPIVIAGIAFILLFNIAAYLIYSPVRTFNAGKQPTADQQLLYAVEKDGAKLYLMGIMHSGKLADFPMRQPIEAAFDSSDFLVTERDLRKPVPSSFYSDAFTDKVSDAVASRVQSLAGAYDLDYKTLKQYDALTVASLFDHKVQELSGLQDRFGQDRYWTYRATQSKKPIVEIEGLAYSKLIADQINYAYSENVLSVIPFDLYQAQQDQLASYLAVKAGDEARVSEQINAVRAQSKELTELYWDERNLHMQEQIMAWLLTDDQYFVAVGVGHVLGESGLIERLKAEGCSVSLVQ